MSPATLYDLVRLLHISADILFIGGMIAGTLVLTALSLQSAAELAKARPLVDGMRRWHRAVTGPALVIAWVCGIWLALQAGWFASGWLHVKLVLVVALSALHGVLAGALRRSCDTAPAVPTHAWRVTPVLVLGVVVGVMWLALMKPF